MSGKIEEAIDLISTNINIFNFQITVHKHPGKLHDKDLQFKVDEMAKAIKFIMDNFFGKVNWKFLKCYP